MRLSDLLRNIGGGWFGASAEDVRVEERQAGAIPYSMVGDNIVFLLITSRRTGRWIFPKGGLGPTDTEWELAEREAYEEAGVRGRIERQPVGSFRTWKTRGIRRFVIEVRMYPLLVETQLDEWPEMKARHRHWATLADAKRLIDDKAVISLIEGVAAWAAVEAGEKASA